MLDTKISNSLREKTKYKNSQLPVGLGLLAVILLFGIYLATISSTLCIYYFTGIAFGFVLQKSRFCFTAAMRDPYLISATGLTKAVLIAIAITTLGFTIVKYLAFVNGQVIPGQDYIYPISLATIAGGFLFGVGMVLASGCASGTLMRIGEGFQIHLITLLFFLAGSLWGVHNIELWSKFILFSERGIFLPDIFGWLPALLLHLSLVLLLYIIADQWESRDEQFSGENKGYTKQLRNNNQKWYQKSWTYLTGAILLSILQIITLIFTRKPWGITTAFTNWGGWIFEALGGDVSHWGYFMDETVISSFNNVFYQDPGTLRNFGIILGALLSALMASQLRIKKIKSKKQMITAVFGGLLMGYGSSIASGCNIGAFYSSISSLSLSGWIFGIFLFLGAIIGGKLLLRSYL